MPFVNLTPHEITIYDQTKSEVVLRVAPSGQPLRIPMEMGEVAVCDGVPIRSTAYLAAFELPTPEADTVFIVSNVVLAALRDHGLDRTDFAAPDNSPFGAVRDGQGNLLGVTGLQQLAR